MVNQIPTPLMAPKTTVTRTKNLVCVRSQVSTPLSPCLSALRSVSTRNNPPPTAKCDTKTCRIDTSAMSSPAPNVTSQTG